MTSNVRAAVRDLRARGTKAGLLRIIAFRPFPIGDVRRLLGVVIPSARNTPARTVYEDHGYRLSSKPGIWSLDLGAERPAPPDWIKLVDHVPEASRVA